MIKPQQMQYRGVQIMDMHSILDRLKSKFIGGPMHVTTFDTSTG
jgi:hypothetical protein